MRDGTRYMLLGAVTMFFYTLLVFSAGMAIGSLLLPLCGPHQAP